MTFSLLRSVRPASRAVAFAAITFAVIGCANFGTPAIAPQGAARHAVRPAAASGFTFYTVDYPGTQPNRVTGIASNQEIVGVYGGGGSQNPYHSYTSQYSSSQPYTQFQRDDYPNAPSTYMAGIMIPPNSKSSVESGYVISPGDLEGTWGVIDNKGLWTLVGRHDGEGNCHMMELFGINVNYYAVGFYWYDDSPPSGNCSKYTQDLTQVRPGEGFHDYTGINGKFPSITGVNKAGWLVGVTDNSGNGPSQGWTKEVCQGCHPWITQPQYWNYNGQKNDQTQMLGVNDSGVVVGTYQDANSNWHGFMVSHIFPKTSGPVWKTVDEPSGNGTNTVISGIDNSGDICGWYTGSDGNIHGFVGIHS